MKRTFLTRWDIYTFTERSLSLSGLATDTNYDIFLYDNAGTLTLEAVAWSNSGAGTSARASAISRLNGVWVKTSDNRRYLGTLRTTATVGQCEDSKKNRFVFNVQNQVARLWRDEIATANWTYSLTSFRQSNNDSNNKISACFGIDTAISLTFCCGADAFGVIAIGLGLIAAASSLEFESQANSPGSLTGIWVTLLIEGFHELNMIERISGGGSPVTFEGTPGNQGAGFEGILFI